MIIYQIESKLNIIGSTRNTNKMIPIIQFKNYQNDNPKFYEIS